MRLHRDAKVDLLRTIPLFSACTAEDLSRVASVADEIDLREGRRLTTEDAPGGELVVLVEGGAEVHQDGRVVNTVGPGEYVGEVALVTGRPRSATVVATSPVHALVIEGHAFQRLLEDSPDLRARIERSAAAHLERDAGQDA
jgi:CRP-like cAMP-binding protein